MISAIYTHGCKLEQDWTGRYTNPGFRSAFRIVVDGVGEVTARHLDSYRGTSRQETDTVKERICVRCI